ncbi:hypothetical protein KAU11_02630, partial [Candidatus Babeliales bacterium]|nr:hypothetical protein [Candidatus Babeliales bacterium]
GSGTVMLNDGVELDLGTAGTLSLESSARLTVEENGDAAIRGDGEVVAQDGGMITLDGVSSLAFGVATSDDIALICRRGGGVNVSAVNATSGNARILFAIGGHQISIIESGFFYVGDNGFVEFGVSEGVPQFGFVELVEISSNGFFLLDTGSKFSMCENWHRNNVVKRCWWDSMSGWIRGTGTVEFIERAFGTTTLSRQLYTSKDEIYFRDTSAPLWGIAKKLVQRDGTLQSVVHFTDVDSGLRTVLTGNDVVVILPSTRNFSAELADGGFEAYEPATRKKIIYGADGEVSQE